jgi:hypothetical protein
MFKTDGGLVETFRTMKQKQGWAFAWRGMASNMTAVALPVAITIFVTDLLVGFKDSYR